MLKKDSFLRILFLFLKEKEIINYMRDMTPESADTTKKQHSVYKYINAFLSMLVSAFVAVFSFYIVSKGVYWFVPIAIYFVLEALFIILPLFIHDAYKAMRTLGVFQIIFVVIFMTYLLFMILWNDANGLMDYSWNTYLVLGVSFGLKMLLALISWILIKVRYNPLLHAYRNNDWISTFYLVLIAALVLSNQFYPGNSVALFDNLLREKPIWIYIINIALNAGLTILAALLALSTDIRSKTKEELSTIGKIKHTAQWFSKNEVSMFFGLIFTTYLAVLAIINMRQSAFYIFLFIYYVATALIRILNYALHKKIQRTAQDNKFVDNRLSSWILLLDAGILLLFSNVLIVGAVFLMINKVVQPGPNLYLFLFFVVPMAIWRFISANSSVKKNRKNNNTYLLGVSLMGIVFSFMSILEIVAIALHNVPIVWVRYLVIILAMIVVKIAVWVVAIIFFIHWIRSMLINSKRRERRFRRKQQQEELMKKDDTV